MKGPKAEEHLIQTPHVDDQNLRLPRDIFLNRLVYEISRHRASVTVVGLELALCAFLIHSASRSNDREIFGMAIGLTPSLGFLIITLTIIRMQLTLNGCGTALANKLQFIKEIATERPGIEMKEWDSIASRMNPVFYKNSPFATPYFFYDGEACYSFFRKFYLKPYLKSKNADNSNNDCVDELQPFVEQAVKLYKEKANKDWQRLLNTGSSLGGQSVDV